MLNAIGTDSFSQIASVGANVGNATVQALYISPCNFKVSKIAVCGTAIAAVTGTHKFNVVVGTGTYTQGSVAANDNSIAGPSVSPNTTYPTAPGGMGYPTNLAVVGNALFAADIPFQATTTYPTPIVPAGSAGGTGQGWGALATTGFYGLFVPTNYDAVYPGGVPLTLRCVTPASTGSITNLLVSMLVEPLPLRGAPMSTVGQIIALPAVDF